MMNQNSLPKKIYLVIGGLIIIFILGAIVSSVINIVNANKIPLPYSQCPMVLEWKTLVPGKSTRYDVIKALGPPDNKGGDIFGDDKIISYFAYNVEGGTIAEYTQNRIYFRSDGTVDWIEEIIADSDGTTHLIRELTRQLGNTIDTVYYNNSYNPYVDYQYDYQAGPDIILVWSDCGIAADVLWGEPLGTKYHEDPNLDLRVRYPESSEVLTEGGKLINNLDGVIMMKFIFQPTTFAGFEEYYRYRIPYGIWTDYLDNYKINNP